MTAFAQAAVIGMIPVRDLAEAELFYGRLLGLNVRGNDGFALILGAGTDAATMIRCVKVPEFVPQSFTILGWEVADLRAASAELRAKGVEPARYPWLPQDEHGIWAAPDGSEVLWFNDPFGNNLSLSHHAKG